GEPKGGKSLLVSDLALSLAAGLDRLGFPVPAACRVLVCQFELPIAQFVSRLATLRRALGPAADQNLLPRYTRPRPTAERPAGSTTLPLCGAGGRRPCHHPFPAVFRPRSG